MYNISFQSLLGTGSLTNQTPVAAGVQPDQVEPEKHRRSTVASWSPCEPVCLPQSGRLPLSSAMTFADPSPLQ